MRLNDLRRSCKLVLSVLVSFSISYLFLANCVFSALSGPVIPSACDTTLPNIYFVPPTPDDGITINDNYVGINVTVIDESNITAFIDWDRSLVGWWRFDNSSDLSDHSTYSNDGTNHGSDYAEYGYFGGARAFDGTDDYIDCGNSSALNIADTITIEAWLKDSPLTLGDIETITFISEAETK